MSAPVAAPCPTQAQCELIFSRTATSWWDSREQTFVDKIEIDYAQLFAWMGLTDVEQSSIMYVTVSNVPTTLESIAGGPRLAAAARSARIPMVRIKNAVTWRAPSPWAATCRST